MGSTAVQPNPNPAIEFFDANTGLPTQLDLSPVQGGAPVANLPFGVANPPKRIQCLGDSNASGANNDGTTGGVNCWRMVAYQYLRALRSDFDFVGSLISAPENAGFGLWYHEGHTGSTLANTAANYATWIASPGVGVPDIVIDELGAADVVAGRTLAQMQADRASMDAAIRAVAPNAIRLAFGIRLFTAGTGTGANLAAWNAIISAYDTWFGTTYLPQQGPGYYYLNLPQLGQGEFGTDGIHWNLQGAGTAGVLVGQALNRLLGLPKGNTLPIPRTFRQQDSWQAYQIFNATDNIVASNHAGFNPGSGSFIFAMDFCPSVLPTASQQAIACYNANGQEWVILQQGTALRVIWNNISAIVNGSGNGSSERCLQVNRWHRIVLMADASTGTVGLYVNGQLVGLAQGLSAWNMTLSTLFVGNVPAFAGPCPGYYGRIHSYFSSPAQTIPRPGSMAALLIAENDYYYSASLIVGGCQANYHLDGALTSHINGAAALTTTGGPTFVSGWPNGMPQRQREATAEAALSVTAGAGIIQKTLVNGANSLVIPPGPDTIVELIGALTGAATLSLAVPPGQKLTILQNTTGAQTVTVAGIAIGGAKRMTGYVDLTNTFQRVTADT